MIELADVTIRCGTFELRDLSCTLPQGGYGVLTGPTGAGKTTLLEAIAGIRRVASGRISLMGRDVTRLPPRDRRVGWVPQEVTLFRTRSVREHLAFAPRIHGLSRPQIEARTAQLSELLDIEAILDRTVHGLSGGERQRVAIGRALAADPQVLLLDEPLSSIDDDHRQRLLSLLKSIQQEHQLSVLHITHSTEEAVLLAEVHWQLNNGRIETVPTVEPRRAAPHVP